MGDNGVVSFIAMLIIIGIVILGLRAQHGSHKNNSGSSNKKE